MQLLEVRKRGTLVKPQPGHVMSKQNVVLETTTKNNFHSGYFEKDFYSALKQGGFSLQGPFKTSSTVLQKKNSS